MKKQKDLSFAQYREKSEQYVIENFGIGALKGYKFTELQMSFSLTFVTWEKKTFLGIMTKTIRVAMHEDGRLYDITQSTF